ncbi:MAG: hypothetical protein KJO31_09330 [Gammaproteobacteria bacterium]|nr:hypothetical protein [Gammaproteobacteria bacterium]
MLKHTLIVLLLLPFAATAEPDAQPLGSMCLARESATFDAAENARLASLSREILTTRQFGLFSFVYSIMPRDGYPLSFDADGTVQAMQFDGARWTLENRELQLWNANDEVFRTFRYNSRCNSLTSIVKMGDQSILMEIAIVVPASE